MKKISTEQEGVITLLNEKQELTGVIRKDPVSRKNVFYSCTEMSFEELQAIFKEDPFIGSTGGGGANGGSIIFKAVHGVDVTGGGGYR